MTDKITKIPQCHYGNTIVYTEPNGGSLLIGGWTKGAHFDNNTHVIDLTGTEHKYWDLPVAFDSESEAFLQFTFKPYAGWLSLPFPDLKVPTLLTTYEQWHGIAKTVQALLKKGRDVLVACHGGHGRSGLFCAIVGYILNISKDRSWSSPVERLRTLHCDEVVETRAQEQFVYDVLGLKIQIKTVYQLDSSAWKYEKCPICGTQSTFVQDLGMCLGCEKKYKDIAPLKQNFTAADLKLKGEIDHACNSPDCIGIWKAKECGHTVHDMVIVDGYCATCYAHMTEEIKTNENSAPCVICETPSWYAWQFGVCYECSQHLATSGQIDFVHNTLTDPYRALPHKCNDIGCVGIVVADVCGHALHNLEVVDGECPICLDIHKGKDIS